MSRIRSRESESDIVNSRMLKAGAVQRRHIARWAVGADELQPGLLSTEIAQIIRDTPGVAYEYVTLTAQAGTLASGGATLTWDTVAEQYGFRGTLSGDTFRTGLTGPLTVEMRFVLAASVGETVVVERTRDGGTTWVTVKPWLADRWVSAGADEFEATVVVPDNVAGDVYRLSVTQNSGVDVTVSSAELTGWVVGVPATSVLDVSPPSTVSTDAWGVTYLDGFYWTSEYDSATIRKVDPATGAVVFSFDAATTALRGLATDGTLLYVVGFDETLYAYTTAGVLDNSRATSGGNTLRGVTFVGANDGGLDPGIWYVEGDNNRIYSTGVDSMATPSPVTDPAGVAWDGAGGFWVVQVGDAATIYRVSRATGAVIDTTTVPVAASVINGIHYRTDTNQMVAVIDQSTIIAWKV